MYTKSEPKIDVWAIRGPTFEVLGAFLRSRIFDEFSIGKKSAKNPTFGVRGSAKGDFTGSWPEGRRVGRALESAEVGRSIRHASGTPLCETGAADPNAPCGASTAAPVFVDRRLLQLIAFCKLQSIDQSSGVCVFYFRLTLAYFCRYLYVLDVCCQFASCQAMLAICKSYPSCKASPHRAS